MTIEKKRVAISFTVEMGEVPCRIASLLKETLPAIESTDEQTKRVVSLLEKKGNIQEAYQSIDNIRQALSKIDFRLEDCQHLLSSYQGALAGLNTSEDGVGESSAQETVEE